MDNAQGQPSTIAAAMGGSATLALGVVSLLLLLISLFGVLWFVLNQQNQAATRADHISRAVTQAHNLLRGVEDMVVADDQAAPRALATEALSKLSTMQSTLESLVVDGKQTIDFREVQTRATAFLGMKNVSVSNSEAMATLKQASTQVARLHEALMRDEVQSRSRAADAARLTHLLLLVAAAASIIGTALIFWMFHRRVTRPLGRAVAVAERISGGDLSQTISTDQAGEVTRLMVALDTMQGRLAQLALNVRENARAVADAAVQVSAGSGNLSGRTEQQATTLEQTAASMEQVTGSARDSAANSRRANDIAREAVAAAHGGGQVVQSAVEKINLIQDSSRKISEVISVIDGIAFQTNILALNAAVEAARAGEQGRGFAVVAGEVRALAQRCATAAREIKALIGDSAAHVETGTALIHEAGGAMKKIVTANEGVVSVIADIAAAMGNQAGSIEKINSAIAQLEAVTQQNAALVEQTAAAADMMRQRAQTLQDLTYRFKLATGHTTEPVAETAEPPLTEPTDFASLSAPAPITLPEPHAAALPR